MTPTFHANCISIENEEFGLQIGFADNEYDTSDYLMFQRADSFDEQDHRLGMANVYVERNDQGFGMYGGVESCDLFPGKFRILFNEQGSKVMGGIREMTITFVASVEKHSELSEALRRCFDGFSRFSEHNA